MTPLSFYDVAQAALDCVCAAMNDLTDEDGVPEGYACPCLVFVSAGEPALDCCTTGGGCDRTDGMLAVHIEDVYPSNTFPEPTAIFEPCSAQTWVARLVVTVARCYPSDDEGNPGSAEDLSANALLMAVDQYAVMTALSCCLVEDAPPGKRKRRVQIEGSRPLVSEGGCSAVEVRVLVEAGVVCNCPQGS